MRFSKNSKYDLIISAAALAVAAAARFKFSIKLVEAPDKAKQNGESILENPRRVLAISAHPDDLEFFAGGLLKLLQTKGHEVHIIDVTDGEKGVKVKNLAKIRRKEQLRAGQALGIYNISFLHLPDLRLNQIEELDKVFIEQLEKVNPDIILTFDYYRPIRAIIHPDHIKVGKSTVAAVKQLSDKRPAIVYYASREPNSIVDISDVLEDKITAVQSHRSQIRFSIRPYASMIMAFARYNSLSTDLRYAECFRIEK